MSEVEEREAFTSGDAFENLSDSQRKRREQQHARRALCFLRLASSQGRYGARARTLGLGGHLGRAWRQGRPAARRERAQQRQQRERGSAQDSERTQQQPRPAPRSPHVTQPAAASARGRLTRRSQGATAASHASCRRRTLTKSNALSENTDLVRVTALRGRARPRQHRTASTATPPALLPAYASRRSA